MSKIQLGILFGGTSSEYDVSLMSARSIIEAVSRDKYEIVQVGITRYGQWLNGHTTLELFETGQTESLDRVVMLPFPDQGRLYRFRGNSLEPLTKLDVIFPVLHGSFGEDGNLQGYLELMDIPYVGANVSASAVSMEKGLFKDIMRAHDIPVVETVHASRHQVEQQTNIVLDLVESRLRYPVFVKPVNLGSSIGVHRCSNRDELMQGMRDAARYSQKIAFEQGVDALEIEVSVLGNDREVIVSIPGEVRYRDSFYSYKAKYFDEDTRLLIPASVNGQTAEEIREIAGKVYSAVGCEGMARIDFLVEKTTSRVYVNELNTIPGFTSSSMYPRLWLESGMGYGELIDRLIELAFERHNNRKQTVFRYSPD